jgi:hypothetical protein
LAGIVFLFALTGVLVWITPAWILTAEMLPAFIAAILIIGALCFASTLRGDPGETYRRLTFLLWWVLLSSEEFFVRLNQTEDTAQGNFAPEAFEEAMVWILVFFCIAVLLMRKPRSLDGLWRGPSKWLSIYAVLCVASCAYSAQKMFSMAWAFKLCIVVLVLQLCRNQIQDEKKLQAFLNATVWGLAFLTIVPPVRALFLPGPIFEDGRLGNSISPTGLSGIAGTLFLAALAFRAPAGNRKTWLLAGAGAIVMFLGGGKTSIIARRSGDGSGCYCDDADLRVPDELCPSGRRSDHHGALRTLGTGDAVYPEPADFGLRLCFLPIHLIAVGRRFMGSGAHA